MSNLNTKSLNIGHIELVNDPLKAAKDFYETQNPKNARLFSANELKIDMSRAIISESYLSNDGGKIILIAALSFNESAQNALLKIIEEPPRDVTFIIYTTMKFLLLPTIRSRLPIIDHSERQKLQPFPLEIKSMDLKGIYLFLKESQTKERGTDSKVQLKRQIQSLYMDSIRYGLHFTQAETRQFERALKWESQYEREPYILLVLLLMVLRKKKHLLSQSLS